MNEKIILSRRSLLQGLPTICIGIAAPVLTVAAKQPAKVEEAEIVTPAEDLMREHGILKRILLIYDEVGSRIDSYKDFPQDTVSNSAKIIRSFIEQYHEKLEEDHLFPRFRKHDKLVELVDVLAEQHQAGRRVTDSILSLTLGGLKSLDDKHKLKDSMRAFACMYAPHEAREDTVLFPALHEIVSKHEYEALGEEFEDKEHQLFGKDGFEEMVNRVAAIEKQLGIYDLRQFTPR